MTDATHKAGLRSLLNGSWDAVFAAIADAVEDPADAEPIIEQIKQHLTTERALCDDAALVEEVEESDG